jgi:hypothetical protein
VLKFYVDFNSQEALDTVVVRLDTRLNSSIAEKDMAEGATVLLYDETMECEALLRRSSYYGWVAKIDRTTIKDVPPEQWNRLGTLK